MDCVDNSSPARAVIRAFRAAEPKDGLVCVDLREQAANSACPGKVSIVSIWSEVERRKGYATKALARLCAVADAQGVALTLEPCPLRYDTDTSPGQYSDPQADRLETMNDLGLDKAQLIAWYAKHGFEALEDGDMLRKPR